MSGFVLDAYAARSCPVKTQNLFLPGLTRPEVDESLAEAFSGGQAWSASVLGQLLKRYDGSVVDCRPLRDQPWQTQVDATLAALADGVGAVIGALLPLDLAGHRSGRIDVLVRGEDRPDGRPGYNPVIVKAHRMTERITPGPNHTSLPVSSMAEPHLSDAWHVPTLGIRVTSREGDLLQLAHTWRLLEAAEMAAGGERFGGIVGTDAIGALNGQAGITWVDLDRKLIRTFSRTAAAGWTKRSALERYDHEHQFRVKVARIAIRHVGGDDDPPLVVTPIRVRECSRCVWWETCRPQLGDDDLSLRIAKSPLDVREIAVLRRLGVSTLTDLATVDLDAFLPGYLPEVAHRSGSEERLRTAARRARLMVDGVELEQVADVVVPQADLEIDLDIETSSDDRVYLWGFLLHDRAAGEEPTYVEFSDFTDLSSGDEAALAADALTWLRRVVEEAPGAVRIYHYSSYEIQRIQRFAQVSPKPVFAWAEDLTRTSFCDLFEVVRAGFFGVYGLGLKQVAHAGPGFEWRDDDPSGLNSQTWFDDAVHAESESARDEAKARVLAYNEDDVRATHALRAWLRERPVTPSPT